MVASTCINSLVQRERERERGGRGRGRERVAEERRVKRIEREGERDGVP